MTKTSAGARLAALAAALLFSAAPLAGGAAAQTDEAGLTTLDPSDPLARLFDQARRGEADPHLPYVLTRLTRALSEQDVIAFLELVDPAYFDEQFGLLSTPDRSPGEALAQFTCEFFSVCDIGKQYRFADIVSGKLISVAPDGGLTGGSVEVTLELRMWDGLTIEAVIFYNPSAARFSAAVG